LGIGTTSPAQKLDVQGAEGRVLLTSTTGTNAAYYTTTNTGGSFNIGRDNSAGGLSGTAYSATLISTGAYPMIFGTNSAVRATLDSSGNLGLGVTPSAWTTSFSAKAFQFTAAGALFGLDVSSSDRRLYLSNNEYFNSSNVPTYINTAAATRYQQTVGEHRWFNAPSGTAGTTITFTQGMTLDASGNLLVGLTSSNNGKISIAVPSGGGWFSSKTGASTENLFGSDGNGNASIFTTGGTNTINFYTNNLERARINNSGNFCINTTSVFSNAKLTVSTSATDGIASTQGTTGGYCFLSNALTNGGTFYHASFGENATQRGSITSNGTVTVYNTTSDYRLKNNQAPLTGSGAFIDALQPKTWNWAQDGSKGVGFIAHEFAEVSPSSVTGEKDAIDAEGNPVHQAMQASSAEVIANLVAEIQSLRKRLADAGI
jgi:hypothetical protein